MHFSEKYENTKILEKCWSSLLLDCQISFLDCQINGAVFMIMQLWGKISIDSTCPNFENVKAAVDYLQSVQTFDGFLVNTIGFGKTFTALLFVAYQAFCAKALLFPGLTIFQPTLCVVSSGLVLFQWLDNLDKFPNLVVIVGYDEQPPVSSSRQQ